MENLCPMAYLCFLLCMVLVSFLDSIYHHTCEIIILWRSKVLSTFDLGGKRRPQHLRQGEVCLTQSSWSIMGWKELIVLSCLEESSVVFEDKNNIIFLGISCLTKKIRPLTAGVIS